MPNYYFNGTKVSEYGVQNNRVDYGTLRDSFNMVNCGIDFIQKTNGKLGEWELVNGNEFYCEDDEGNKFSVDKAEEKIRELEEELDELMDKDTANDSLSAEEIEEKIDRITCEISTLSEEKVADIFQCYLISQSSASILMENTQELVYFNSELDMYVWAITFGFGLDWNMILTDIPLQ